MIIQILVYKVALAKLKYLYLVYHVGRQNLRESINNFFTKVMRLLDIIINLFFLKKGQLLGGSLCGAQIP